MKLRSHSGLKKRVKKHKRKLMMQKSCKNHLLINKSKRQKRLKKGGFVIDKTRVKHVRKLLPYA